MLISIQNKRTGSNHFFFFQVQKFCSYFVDDMDESNNIDNAPSW